MNATYSLMTDQASKLTAEMDAIFNPYKAQGYEAPEFMPECDLVKWDILYGLRKEIYDFQRRIDSICDSFNQFYATELA